MPAVVTAKVALPKYDGQYVLVWDIMIDDEWLSTLPITRGGDILPVSIEINNGKLAFVDLSKLYDISAASPDVNRTIGDFDGKGSSFPSEYLPPDASATEMASQVYPSGYNWDRETHPDGRISFLYPEKSAEEKNNALACSGQTVEVENTNYVALHILGASSNGDASGDISLNYSGSSAAAPIEMSDWGEGPKHGEQVGYLIRHRHSHGGDEIGTNCYLYHYTIPLDPAKTLTSLTLPKNTDMKIVAITLERADMPAIPAEPAPVVEDKTKK